MIGQQEIFEISLKLFGSMKLLSSYLDLPVCELIMYYENRQEMPLSLYMNIQMLIEKEVDGNIETFFETDYQDFLTMKRIRKNLNLSLSDMADLLGLSGRNASELVKLMENGCIPILGPIARIVRYLSQSALKQRHAFDKEYLVCKGFSDEGFQFSGTGILATTFPRFMAKTVPNDHLNPMKPSVQINDFESLELDSWIDNPRVIDEQRICIQLDQAVKYLRESYCPKKASV